MENSFYKHRINCVIDYIEENLDKKLTLNELAKVANFSKYHFHRIFKAVLGETLNNYIKRIKMEKICRQISIQHDKSLTEIAFDMGYNSSSNFSRDIYNYYNISPSEIRVIKKYPDIRETKYDSDINISFVGVDNIPDKQIIYERISNGYNALIISEVFKELYKFVERNHSLSIEQFIGIGYDDPDYTPPKKCRYDACISVNGKVDLKVDLLEIFPYNTKVLKGGKYAVFSFEGKPEQFSPAWDVIFREWVISSQYVPDNRPHLMYLPNDKYQKGVLKANLYLPVKKYN